MANYKEQSISIGGNVERRNPIRINLDAFASAINKIDERREKTLQQKNAIKAAIGQAKLNAAEDEWKANYIAGIENKINSAAMFGDMSQAYNTALDLAGTAASDPALLGRVRANEQYEKEVQTQQARRDKGEISQNTYDWWMSNNPYKYEDTYDSNDNIIGGTSFEAENRPVADINWAAQAQAAFKMISPYKKTKGSETSVSSNKPGDKVGDNIVTDEYGYSSSSGGQHTIEKVTKQQILDNIENLLSSTPDGYRQAEQAFDVANYEIEKMVKQYEELMAKDPTSAQAKNLGQKLEARRKLMYQNGSPIDYKEYYARMVTDNAFAEGLAYEWRTDVSHSSSTTSGQGGTSGGRQKGSTTPYPGAHYSYEDGLWYGPSVRQQTDTEGAQQGVGGAASNINNRFNKQS